MRTCYIHNFKGNSCPYCKQEKHNEVVEHEAKKHSAELRIQSELSSLQLEEQRRLAEAQRVSNEKSLEIQKKTLRVQEAKFRAVEAELANQKRFRCVGIINELLPAIVEKYGASFLITYYLRVVSAIEIWSNNLVPRDIVRDALAEHLNETTAKVLKASDELSSLVENKQDEIKSDLQIRLNKIAAAKNIQIQEGNTNKGTFISGLAAVIIFWLLFQTGFGFFFIILSGIVIAICLYIYDLLSINPIRAAGVSKSEVSTEYQKFLKSISWYSNEIAEAEKLARAIDNGALSTFPLLNKWDANKEGRTKILSVTKSEISIAKKFKS